MIGSRSCTRWAISYKIVFFKAMANKKTPKKSETPRKRKAPTYKSFRLSKKIKYPSQKPLPGIIRLCRYSFIPLRKNKWLFIGIILIHFALTLIFKSGLTSSMDFVNLKDNIEQTFGGDISKVGSAVALFSYAVSSSGGDAVSANYEIFASLIVILAIIWSIRQTLAGEMIYIRQAFYQGVYPLVPFMVILVVIAVQMIPSLIGNLLLSTVLANGLAISAMEKAFWWILFFLFLTLSLYMIISSIFGLYISTLPDMTPMRALRSARGLVLHRRVQVGLRLAGLPILLLIFYVIILVPLIFILPVAVIPAFLLLNSFNLFFVNSYLYSLYRELL